MPILTPPSRASPPNKCELNAGIAPHAEKKKSLYKGF